MVALLTRHIFNSSLRRACCWWAALWGAEGAGVRFKGGVSQHSCGEAAEAVCASRDMAVAAVLRLVVFKPSLCGLLTK